MTLEDISKREHLHTQQYIYRFQSVTWAPEKGRLGAMPKFGVEAMVYVPGMGWDAVNPFVQNSEFILAFYYYVLSKEMMGYEHAGLSSAQIKNRFDTLWEGKNKMVNKK